MSDGPSLSKGGVSIPGYEVERELGRGGFAVVYRAKDTRLNRTVALKMVLDGGRPSPQDLARFRVEAEAVAAVDHRHVVRVFGSGEAGGSGYAVYVRPMDGSPAVRLGDGFPLGLSRDRRWVLASVASRPWLLPTISHDPFSAIETANLRRPQTAAGPRTRPWPRSPPAAGVHRRAARGHVAPGGGRCGGAVVPRRATIGD